MKIWKKILTAAITLAMTFVLMAGSVCAAEYTYTVTFSLGNHGEFGAKALEYVTKSEGATAEIDGDRIVVKGLKQGDTVGFNASAGVVLEKESKYYVQGVRLSGRDNDEKPQFIVNGDMDYVVAYGVKGDQVKYTVKYVREDGTPLVADEVFYGNVGDKPVVAYKYIAGYAPKALGLTKTLSANEKENIFEFVYTDATEYTTKEYTTTDVDYVNTFVTVDGSATNVTDGAASNITGGVAGTAGVQASQAGTEEGLEGGMEEADESGIIDLDDEEVPLANIDADTEGENVNKALPMVMYVGMGILALIAIVVAVYFMQKFKNKKQLEK